MRATGVDVGVGVALGVAVGVDVMVGVGVAVGVLVGVGVGSVYLTSSLGRLPAQSASPQSFDQKPRSCCPGLSLPFNKRPKLACESSTHSCTSGVISHRYHPNWVETCDVMMGVESTSSLLCSFQLMSSFQLLRT